LLDSQGILRLVKDLSNPAAIHQFFRLSDWSIEVDQIHDKSIDELADLVSTTLLDGPQQWQALTLSSSGSTGEPKPIRHSRESLESECASWRALLPDAKRVLSLVPSHHLYGLVWSVLWPCSAGIPAEDARDWEPSRWREGDVIVAVPLQWEKLLQRVPRGVTAISSAGVLPEKLWDGLKALGMERIIEVYGSTETGGVAIREAFQDPYRFAAHWTHRVEDLPDEIEPCEGGGFRILRRKDGGVKVAGSLVYPSLVQQALLELPAVENAKVRYIDTENRARLEALVITQVPETEYAQLELQIKRDLGEKLQDAAIPRLFSFRRQLPTNQLGKVVLW